MAKYKLLVQEGKKQKVIYVEAESLAQAKKDFLLEKLHAGEYTWKVIDGKLENPGTSSTDWIPCHAVKVLPSGDIQLLTEKGTMSNPGKRKSFLKKVGKVFGKVVRVGKGILGNPSEIAYEEGPYIIYETGLGYAIYKISPMGFKTKIAIVKSKGNAIEIVSKRLDRGK